MHFFLFRKRQEIEHIALLNVLQLTQAFLHYAPLFRRLRQR
ncbi:Uncharacterised protein [Vibrio cholerae]|nr:Uncharacterised protein [Vibrio cholerae]